MDPVPILPAPLALIDALLQGLAKGPPLASGD